MNLTNQQKKALDLNRHLTVIAGAGSGKTTLLVERFIHILLTQPNVKPGNLLAITFTDKAAQEMKFRILERLQQKFQETAQPFEKERIFEIIKSFGEAQISTIHAFCKKILIEYAWAIRLNPDFKIASDPEIKSLLNEVFWELFLENGEAFKNSKDFRMLALQHLNFKEIKDLLFSAYEKRVIIQSFVEVLARSDPETVVGLWERTFREFHRTLFREVISDVEVHRKLKMLRDAFVLSKRKTAEKFVLHVDAFLSEVARGSDTEMIINSLIDLLNFMYTQQGQLKKLILEEAKKADEATTELLLNLDEKLAPLVVQMVDAPPLPDEERELAQFTIGISQILLTFFKQVEQKKKQLNLLGFDDLLFYTHSLLTDYPNLRSELQQKYQWILVDEFQDTDILQAQIIQHLVHDLHDSSVNNLFIVGDPKQSIYGFRRADVSIFLDFMEQISKQISASFPFQDPLNQEELEATSEEKSGRIKLARNFRSIPPLITFYNHLFQEILKPLSAYDVEFSGLEAARQQPAPEQEYLHFILLEAEKSMDLSDIIPLEVETVADTILQIVNNPDYRIAEENQENVHLRPIEYRDIAILLRGRERLDELVEGLRKKKIPYQVHQGIGFYQTREVRDIYHLLRAIYDPEDDFAMIGALRSPFIGVSDIGIFYLNQTRGQNFLIRIHKLLKLDSANTEEVFKESFAHFLKKNQQTVVLSEEDVQSLQLLADHFSSWRLLVQKANFSRLLLEVIDELHIAALLKEMEFGEQKLANLDKLVQFAYAFEKSTSRKIGDFLHHLKQLIDGEIKEGEAPLYTERENQVQILTIHSAKGLEFPVVLVPFLENRINFREDLFSDKNSGVLFPYKFANSKTRTRIQLLFEQINRLQKLAEEKRLLYVALTRAQDFLFLVGARGFNRQPGNSTLNLILEALDIYNTSPGDLQAAFQHPFGIRIEPKIIQKETTLSKIEEQSHLLEIVDQKMNPDTDTSDIRQAIHYAKKVIPETTHREFSPTQIMIYQENPQRYIDHYFLKNGVIYPPQISEDYEDQPSGQWWGTLVHRMLENFQSRTPEQDKLFLHLLFKNMKIPPGEWNDLENALLKLMVQFRASELGRQLQNATQRSEVRITLPLSRGKLTGVLDRIYKNPRGLWEVVDFKTNRMRFSEIDGFTTKYLLQVKCYALLLHSLFPEQGQYPITLFFLSVMQPKRFVFETGELEPIRSEIEKAIEEIQKVDIQFYYGLK